jgi:hypothetical protein
LIALTGYAIQETGINHPIIKQGFGNQGDATVYSAFYKREGLGSNERNDKAVLHDVYYDSIHWLPVICTCTKRRRKQTVYMQTYSAWLWH